MKVALYIKTKKQYDPSLDLVIEKFEENLLEPELRPEYVEKLKKIDKQKGKFKEFVSIAELRREIENA